MSIEKLRLQTTEVDEYGEDGVRGQSLDGGMFLAGGWNPNYQPITNSKFRTSRNKGKNWAQLPEAPWVRRHDFIIGTLTIAGEECIIVCGGDGDNITRDVWAFGYKTGWRKLTSDWGDVVGDRLLAYYCNHTVGGVNYLYVAGGRCPDRVGGYGNDVVRTSNGITWTKVADLPVGMQDLDMDRDQRYRRF
jgi:hypothetical protein